MKKRIFLIALSLVLVMGTVTAVFGGEATLAEPNKDVSHSVLQQAGPAAAVQATEPKVVPQAVPQALDLQKGVGYAISRGEFDTEIDLVKINLATGEILETIPNVLPVGGSKIPTSLEFIYGDLYLSYTTGAAGGMEYTLAKYDPLTAAFVDVATASTDQKIPLVYVARDIHTGITYAIALDNMGSGPSLNTLNIATGELTKIADLPEGSYYAAMDKSGQMYIVNHRDDSLYKLDKATGATTLIGTTGLNIWLISEMAFDNDTGKLYLMHYGSNGGALYELNLLNGHATLVKEYGNFWYPGFAIYGGESASMVLTKTVAEMKVGETAQVAAAYTGPEAELVWSSSNKDVVSIADPVNATVKSTEDTTANLIANAPGTARISVATADGQTIASFDVTVKEEATPADPGTAAGTVVKVPAKAAPKTGDESMVSLGVMLLILAGAAGLTMVRRKN